MKNDKQKEAQALYEEYRRNFAETWGHSIEFATECQSVRLYKHYLEEKYDITINDEV